MQTQADLFTTQPVLPSGFSYRPDLISLAEERELVTRLEPLAFREFAFHGFFGKRRVVSFGWRYDYNGGGLKSSDDIPDFLQSLRERAARFAGMEPGKLQQALVTEYRPGAAIGWHRDRPVFGDVVGISLLSSCVFRLRRKNGGTWERASLTAEPRSAYVLRGPARTGWEHSIPAVHAPRYSVTFRSFKAD